MNTTLSQVRASLPPIPASSPATITPPMRTEMDFSINYLSNLLSEVGSAKTQGLTVEQTVARVTLPTVPGLQDLGLGCTSRSTSPAPTPSSRASRCLHIERRSRNDADRRDLMSIHPPVGHTAEDGNLTPRLAASLLTASRSCACLAAAAWARSRATDRYSGDTVALKLLHAEISSRDESDRFLREAQLLSELRHPGIVAHVAHGQTPDGQRYLAMEWLDGQELSERLARGPRRCAMASDFSQQVADALAVGHRRGIIHRDSNLEPVPGRWRYRARQDPRLWYCSSHCGFAGDDQDGNGHWYAGVHGS